MDIDQYKLVVNKAMGDVLRQIRRSADLSQLRVGQMLDVSYQQIHRYEIGEVSFPIYKWFMFIEALKLDPEAAGEQARDAITEALKEARAKAKKKEKGK